MDVGIHDRDRYRIGWTFRNGLFGRPRIVTRIEVTDKGYRIHHSELL